MGLVCGLHRELPGAVQELHLRSQVSRRVDAEVRPLDERGEGAPRVKRGVVGRRDAASPGEQSLEALGDSEAVFRGTVGRPYRMAAA